MSVALDDVAEVIRNHNDDEDERKDGEHEGDVSDGGENGGDENENDDEEKKMKLDHSSLYCSRMRMQQMGSRK